MPLREGKTLLIVYSSGDLGDVGRHCVAMALKHPRVRCVKVVTDQPPQHLFDEKNYNKCCCPPHTHELLGFKDRLRVYPANISSDDFSHHVQNVDAVITCLGNRLPFHPDWRPHIAEYGTTRIVEALLDLDRTRQRIIMLSSVGIGNDWPPLEGLQEGNFLQGLFRTICWEQYQDLSGAERALRRTWSSNQLDYVTARCVLLPDGCPPTGLFQAIDQPQGSVRLGIGDTAAGERRGSCGRAGSDYDKFIAKLDAAQFLIQEAVLPSLHRQVVILGGRPAPIDADATIRVGDAKCASFHS